MLPKPPILVSDSDFQLFHGEVGIAQVQVFEENLLTEDVNLLDARALFGGQKLKEHPQVRPLEDLVTKVPRRRASVRITPEDVLILLNGQQEGLQICSSARFKDRGRYHTVGMIARSVDPVIWRVWSRLVRCASEGEDAVANLRREIEQRTLALRIDGLCCQCSG